MNGGSLYNDLINFITAASNFCICRSKKLKQRVENAATTAGGKWLGGEEEVKGEGEVGVLKISCRLAGSYY